MKYLKRHLIIGVILIWTAALVTVVSIIERNAFSEGRAYERALCGKR